MKLFFVDERWSALADKESPLLKAIRNELVADRIVRIVDRPEQADAIILQEKGSFKDFRYIGKLLSDPLISAYADRVFTINNDDCATGLLRGVYTSLPRSRFNATIHAVIPFMTYPNELVVSEYPDSASPQFLAGWRGNVKSNRLRLKLLSALASNPDFCVETTDSWLNHGDDEKATYVELIRKSKYSLCPAGWAPVTYRIYESMALRRCPVILADDFVPPQGPDWSQCALFYPERSVTDLGSFLYRHEHLFERLGENAFRAWRTLFSPDVVPAYCTRVLLSLIANAPPASRASEERRWRSLELYWSNKWTLPQRVMNKVNKWTRVVTERRNIQV